MIYQLPFGVPAESSIPEFQFSVLNRVGIAQLVGFRRGIKPGMINRHIHWFGKASIDCIDYLLPIHEIGKGASEVIVSEPFSLFTGSGALKLKTMNLIPFDNPPFPTIQLFSAALLRSKGNWLPFGVKKSSVPLRMLAVFH